MLNVQSQTPLVPKRLNKFKSIELHHNRWMAYDYLKKGVTIKSFTLLNAVSKKTMNILQATHSWKL